MIDNVFLNSHQDRRIHNAHKEFLLTKYQKLKLHTAKDQGLMICMVYPGEFHVKCEHTHVDILWRIPEDVFMEVLNSNDIKLKVVENNANNISHTETLKAKIEKENDFYRILWKVEGLVPAELYDFQVLIKPSASKDEKYPGYIQIAPEKTCSCVTWPNEPSDPVIESLINIKGNSYQALVSPQMHNSGDINYTLSVRPKNYDIWSDINFDQKSNSTADIFNFKMDFDPRISQLKVLASNAFGSAVFIKDFVPHHDGPGASNTSLGDITFYSFYIVATIFIFTLIILLFVYRRSCIRFFKSRKLASRTYRAHYSRSEDGRASKINLFPFSSSSTFSGRSNALDANHSHTTFERSLEGLHKSEDSYLVPGVLSLAEDPDNADPKYFERVPKIPSAHIRFVRYIGCGAFGKVWEGWLHVNAKHKSESFKKVALKVRNHKSLTESQFKREAALMQRYQHKNIVCFYGISFDSPIQQCLVLEMMDQGSLREYLHRARPKLSPSIVSGLQKTTEKSFESPSSSNSLNTDSTHLGSINQHNCSRSNMIGFMTLPATLDIGHLIEIMKDIAYACEYLENQKFVHRDIAARNCLVSHSHPSGRVVKLCDFGLARDLYKNDYYRTCNEPKLPVRWMSPEAIREGLFTTKSDIWAYAVTCWEVMTLGADPFYGRMNYDVMNLVLAGHVLGRPENCPEELYNQMLLCWSSFPEVRPSFQEIVKTLEMFSLKSKEPGNPFNGKFIVSLPLPKDVLTSPCNSSNLMSKEKNTNLEPNDTQNSSLTKGMLLNSPINMYNDSLATTELDSFLDLTRNSQIRGPILTKVDDFSPHYLVSVSKTESKVDETGYHRPSDLVTQTSEANNNSIIANDAYLVPLDLLRYNSAIYYKT